MNWDIPRISNSQLSVTLETGDKLFIVGANGSGKSALIQRLVSSDKSGRVRRISAHRQTWFHSGKINLTSQSRINYEQNNRAHEMQYKARWTDYDASTKLSAVFYDLVAKETARALLIAQHVDNRNNEEANKISAESPSLFDQLNKLLALGTFEVTLKNSGGEEILAQRRDTDLLFNIAQMSDGERNAVIIAATVLTAEKNTVLLIDEPEQDLHRSIIEPFVSALFEQRKDCTFVVSTHEIALPIVNPKAQVLMVRSCKWSDNKPSAWDVEVLKKDADIPEDLRRAILGSRKKILFVEGDFHSLDLSLYSKLFPSILVIPKGGCREVQRAVSGARGLYDFHHVEAFGLIDGDGRVEEEIKQFAQNNVFSLNVHSAEALYYCSDAIASVAHRQAESLNHNFDEMIKTVKEKALSALKIEGLAEEMAARRCEHQAHALIASKIPNWKSIKNNETPEINISVPSPYQNELDNFKKLVADGNLDDLVSRYPLRKSMVFSAISRALELTGEKAYEQTLISQIQNDKNLVNKLRQRVGPLSDALVGPSEIT